MRDSTGRGGEGVKGGNLLKGTQPLVCLVGPTGVGKSEMALGLAERLGAEIVCADSRQIYRGLDIGTAKPTAAERRRVPHHLLDLVDPDEAYSAGRYGRDASECLEAAAARNARVIIVGGTGLYVRALLWGLCEGPTADDDLRAVWLEREQRDPGSIYRHLSQVDRAAATAIHPNDVSKALRALEVFELTGSPLSVRQRAHGFGRRRYAAVTVGLRRERDELYRRINERVDAMVAAGLVGEVEGLIRRGFGPNDPGMRAVGYRQVAGALRGAYDVAEATRLVKRDTRRYAKRQMTWFGSDPTIQWVDIRATERIEDIVRRVEALVASGDGVMPSSERMRG